MPGAYAHAHPETCARAVYPALNPGPALWFEVTDAAKGWFSHEYAPTHAGASATQSHAPPGTCSWADRLLADPSTRGQVGIPTVFFSHAWGDSFAAVSALGLPTRMHTRLLLCPAIAQAAVTGYKPATVRVFAIVYHAALC